MQNIPPSYGTVPPDNPPGNKSEKNLLVTKLAPPKVPPDLLARPRLTRQLQIGIQYPLTLIAAPAGFGKTTLLATWLEQTQLSTAWISLDGGDNDLVRFWSYVITALERIRPGSGASALSLLQASSIAQLSSVENILSVWINELAVQPNQIAIVLDDYHLITAPPIHRAVSFLIDHLPPQMHLVIATRADPPLPLARLRAQGHLIEIRSVDLRFTTEEVMAFLAQSIGPSFSSEDISALEARTEGWIVGLRLAALSLQKRKDISNFLAEFTGSHRYIIDYLVDEVLSNQPEPIQTFLLRTAILEQLQGSLCDAVMGESGEEGSGPRMLKELEQANLFLLPLDNERLWYRYHQLFAEALRHQLQRRDAALIPELHHRASSWYEQHGLLRDAVHHALAAKDFDLAVRLIEQVGNSLVRQGEITTLQQWVSALPPELVHSRVEIAVWQGWLLFVWGKNAEALRHLQDIEQTFNLKLGSDVSDGPQTLSEKSAVQPAILGRLAAIRASIAIANGDIADTISFSTLALAYLPKEAMARAYVAEYLGKAYYIQGDMGAARRAMEEACRISWEVNHIYGLFLAVYDLAQLLKLQGQLSAAERICRQALQQVKDQGDNLPARGPAFVILGSLEHQWNHLDTAIALLQDGIRLCEQTANLGVVAQAFIELAFIHQASGDKAEATAMMRRAVQIAQQPHLVQSRSIHEVEASRAWLALIQGDEVTANRWLHQCDLRVDQEINHLREREYLTLVRILIAQHQLNEAGLWLKSLLRKAESQERTGSVIEILMLQAEALQASGDVKQANDRFSRALSLAEPEEYIRLFVAEGEPVARLLGKMAPGSPENQSAIKGYRERLLLQVGGAHTEINGIPQTTSPDPSLIVQPLDESLSERELELRRLVASGYSNREISERLFITISTVKWYLNTIYAKLQVESRTKAIVRARELKIV